MRVVLSAALIGASQVAHAMDDVEDKISNYLADMAGGAVSAASIAGTDPSAVTRIQSAQDLALVLRPVVFGEGQRAAFGLAVTPARTSALAMSGARYMESTIHRAVANLTISYAQAPVRLGGTDYRRSAYSIDTHFYLHLAEDPAYAASMEFADCASESREETALHLRNLDEINRRREAGDARAANAFAAENRRHAQMLFSCTGRAREKRESLAWNTSRMALGYGAGHLKSASDGHSSSLGRFVSLNAQFRAGSDGALQLSLRNSLKAPDAAGAGKSRPPLMTNTGERASRLIAVRYTHGLQTSELKVLAEANNSNANQARGLAEASSSAVGIEMKVVRGGWLELRVGRTQTAVGEKPRSVVVVNFSLAPTLFDLGH